MDNTSFAPGNNSINNSTPPPSPFAPESSPKHFLNKKFVITFVILLLLGAGTYAGIWYWQKQQLAQEVVPTLTPRPSATPDPTAGWKTYTNIKYGFEVKTPASLVQSETQPAGITQESFSLNGKTVFSISIFNSQNAITKSYGSDWKAVATPTIDGYQVTELQRTTGQYTETAYLINVKNISINFEDSTFSAVSDEILNQILSTFKFTDSVDTSTWKTYTNGNIGFSFKYPADMSIQETDTIYPEGSNMHWVEINLVNGDKTFSLGMSINNPGRGGNLAANPITREVTTSDNKTISYQTGLSQSMGDDTPGPERIWQGQFESNRSGYLFEFTTQTGADETELVEKIISTFKFTK